MDYFFSKILTDLYDRISVEVPEINYIDQDLGQLGQTNDDDRISISSPAVLIDFPNSDYSELGQGAQLGAINISFQLIFETYSQTWHKAPKEVINKGLEYLRVEQKLYNALQKWNLDYFTPLIRSSIKSQNNNDLGLRVRTLNFTTSYEDYLDDENNLNEFEIKFNGDLK